MLVVFVDAGGCNSWRLEAQLDVMDELLLGKPCLGDEEVVAQDPQILHAQLVEGEFERHRLFFMFLIF